MFALLNVHLTGGKPLWQELVGPVLLALTAIAAAAIAARTANTRQAAQPLHDRELHYREHTRNVVDQAVTTASAVYETVLLYEGTVRTREHERAALESVIEGETTTPEASTEARDRYLGPIQEVHEVENPAIDRNLGLPADSLRLTLRFGLSAPVVRTHRAYQEAYTARFTYVAAHKKSGLESADSGGSVALVEVLAPALAT